VADFNGPVEFSYNVSDGDLIAAATADLTVTPVNDAPVVGEAVALGEILEDGSLIITAEQLLANATDIEGDALSITGLSADTGYLIDNGNGSWTYQPVGDYNGLVEISYNVSDGELEVAATAGLTVTPVNDAPVVSEAVALGGMLEDGSMVITAEQLLANATDIDGDALSVIGLSVNTGSLTDNGDGSWTYQPAADFNGPVEFNYSVTDSELVVAATAGLTVTPVNDAPVVSGAVALGEMLEDGNMVVTAEQLLANATDVDGDNLNIIGLSADTGNLTDNGDGSWTYKPAADYNGPVEFNYSVTDGELPAAATAALTVTPVNDLPAVPVGEQHSLLGTLTLAGTLAASDVDGDPLGFAVTTLPQHGVLTIDEEGRWVYAADDGYCGSDQAVITVDDGNGGTVATVLDFTVNVYTGGDFVIDGDGPVGLRLDGIGKDDLHLVRQEDDLHIEVRDRGTILLKGYFIAPENGTEWLDTTDGPLHLAKDVITESTQGSWWGWLLNKGTYGSEAKDLIYGSGYSDKLYGRGQNDLLFGDGGNDYLEGNSGDDTLVGGEGPDLLVGGAGHDTLYGDDGADALLGGGGNDCLVGGDGSDLLWGDGGNDRMYGDAGNDLLSGGRGDDLLTGGQGNDQLYGDDGNDTLIGGAGDDVLSGGEGSDLYLFEKGAGHDQVVESFSGFCWWGGSNDDEDVIRFGGSVNKEDVAFFSRWGSLQIGYGAADQVDVMPSGFGQTGIERIELADGSYLTDADVNQLIQQMAAFAVDEGIAMNSLNDVRDNQELMTLVANSWHSA
jgi:VCBS repeat-containing protein